MHCAVPKVSLFLTTLLSTHPNFEVKAFAATRSSRTIFSLKRQKKQLSAACTTSVANPIHASRSPPSFGVPTTSLIQSYRQFGALGNNQNYSKIPRFSSRGLVALKMSSSLTSSTLQQTSSEKGWVMVIGSANQDLTSYTRTVPTMGETVMGSSFETSCGGKGANQAVAAASLEIVPVSMVCRVGADSFGESLLNNFREAGVTYNEEKTTLTSQTTNKDDESSHTGVAPIMVNTQTGDNMIVVIPGANHQLSPQDVRDEIKKYSKSSPSVIITQLEVRMETALEAMKVGKEELGESVITILNPAPAPEEGGLVLEEMGFWNYVDILIPNETELRTLVGKNGKDEDEEEMAKVLLNKGVKLAVIVTLGARGAMIVSRSNDKDDDFEVTMVQAPSELPCNNEPVQDTVGAGDAFCGSLSAYLSAGLDLASAATKACGFASMSVRKRGAQTSYPRAFELPEILRIPDGDENIGGKDEKRGKREITFVTGNKKKLEEVQQILSTGVDIPFGITNRKIDLPELQGDPLEIAVEKCKIAAAEVGGPVLTEDTSLCFNALNGMPGPYIKWFLEKCGHGGLNDMLAGFEDKTAYAQTVVAFTAGPGQKVHVFDGRTDGKIVKPRGPLDFGWDPIFEPCEGGGKTYAEMEKDAKNVISHRGRSFAKLQSFFVSEGDDIIKSMG